MKKLNVKSRCILKTRYMKLIVMVLAIILIISSLPITAYTIEYPQNNTVISQDEQKEKISVEAKDPELLKLELQEESFDVIALREENVKHFQLEDGTFQAVAYGNPVHRKDKNGIWTDIDNTLSLSNSIESNEYSTSDGRMVFAKDLSSDMSHMTLNENGYSVSMSLVANEKTNVIDAKGLDAKISNHPKKSALSENLSTAEKIEELSKIDNKTTVTYENILQNVDLEYILVSNDVKENIIVKSRCDNYSYIFEINLTGLNAILCDNGAISLCDTTSGKSIYTIPAPFMYDSNGNYSYGVTYKISDLGEGKYQLAVEADNSWINTNGRAFPVTIDPTIQSTNAAYDTYIKSTSPDSEYGYDNEMWVSSTDTSFIRINMPILPSGSTVIAGSLNAAYYYHVSTGSANIGAYRVLNSWLEGSLTWNIANQNPNLGISTTLLSSTTASASSSINYDNPRYISFNVTSAVLSWYSGTANNGIALKYLSGTNLSVIFKPYEAYSGYTAYFTITYTEPRIPNGVYKLKNVYNNLYIDVFNGESTAGTSIIQWPGTYNDNKLNQLFKITFVTQSGSLNYYSIRPMTNSGLGLYTPLSGTNRDATIELITTNDSWVELLYNNAWAISKTGNYYTIKNGTSTTNSYLTTPMNSTNGEPIFTGENSSTNNSKWIFEPYTGEALNNITFTNITWSITTGNTFDYDAYMYSSAIGRNGPVTWSVVDTDNTNTDKATINATTGIFTAIKSGVVKVRATYSGAPSLWVVNVTINKSLIGYNYIVNASSYRYMSPNDSWPAFGDQLEQWDYSNSGYLTWELIYQAEDIYKIRNFITGEFATSPTSTSEGVNITSETELSGDDANRQKWKFILQSDGTYQIRALNRDSLVMSVSNNTEGDDIDQRSPDIGIKTKWYVVSSGAQFSIYGGMASRTFELRRIGDTTSDATWLPIVSNSVNAWNNSGAGTNITTSNGGDSPYTIQIDTYAGEQWTGVCIKNPNGKNVFSTTSAIQISTAHIAADISFIGITGTTGISRYRQAVIVHEIGHLLWLADNPPETNSIMTYSASQTIAGIFFPQTYDVDNVCITYD